MHDIGRDSVFEKKFTTAARFLAPSIGKVNVDPSSEQVPGVPVAFPVAEEHERVGRIGHGVILPDRGTEPVRRTQSLWAGSIR